MLPPAGLTTDFGATVSKKHRSSSRRAGPKIDMSSVENIEKTMARLAAIAASPPETEFSSVTRSSDKSKSRSHAGSKSSKSKRKSKSVTVEDESPLMTDR